MRPADRTGRATGLLYKVLLRGWLAVACIAMVAPIYWAFVASLRPPEKSFNLPPSWFPTNFTLSNYRRIFTVVPFLRMIGNSLLVTGMVTLITLATSVLAAYAFARLRFPGRDPLFALFLATMMIPGAVLIVPVYLIVKDLGLLNSLTGVWLPGTVSAFGIFLVRQWFLGIPRELEEAALCDGASRFRILWSIFLPLSGPVLTTHALVIAQATWKDFFWPNIVLSDVGKMTAPVGIVYLKGTYNSEPPTVSFAAVMLVTIPLVVLFLFTQRFITESMVRAGVKG